MAMFAERIDQETPELHDEGVRMRFIGRRDRRRQAPRRADGVGARRRPPRTTGSRCSSRSTTAGRAEIVDAARTFTGETEEDFAQHLYAPEMHDPDLIIRTSGEQRLSNYLLWQSAYSELVFRDELWPDFSRAGLRGVAGGVRRAPPALRRALMPPPPRRRRSSPPQRRARRAERRNTGSDLGARVIVAIPPIAFAVFIVLQGGWVSGRGPARARPACACTSYFELVARPAPGPPRRLPRR